MRIGPLYYSYFNLVIGVAQGGMGGGAKRAEAPTPILEGVKPLHF